MAGNREPTGPHRAGHLGKSYCKLCGKVHWDITPRSYTQTVVVKGFRYFVSACDDCAFMSSTPAARAAYVKLRRELGGE